MLRRIVGAWIVLCVLPVGASAQFVAEQVTLGNAATRLFQGTDADGGIGDWYLSNGVVEAIIDDVGPQADLVGLLGPAAPPKSSEAAFTGGALIDVGRVGADSDQLAQMFTVGGLSTSNFILYDSVGVVAGSSSATVSVSGGLRGFDGGANPIPPSQLPVVTEYTASGSDPYITIRSTVTNTHPTFTASGLGGFLDAFIWVTRGIVPFSPLPNRGFTHAALDFNNLGFALELPTFSAGPGNVSPAYGVIDPPSGRTAGEVAYGLLGETLSVDQDGPGPNPPVVTTVNTLFGVSSNLITGLGNLPAGGLSAGGILQYTRRLYVGTRNDVASVANDMIGVLAARQSYATGTISGNVDANDTANLVASIIATRTGGPTIPGLATGAPVNQVRTDASGAFSGVVLPVGTYDLSVRAAERDAVTVSGVVVNAAADTAVSVPPLSGLGTLVLTARERQNGPDPLVPAKITIKGIGSTPDPVLRRDVDAFALQPSGPPQDIMPETFAGGPGQRNQVLLADGDATVQLRPGRYTLYASRGPEYAIAKRRVRVREGRTHNRKFTLRRIVDTTDFLSADFHIHSARSLDTSPPLIDRVASFAGEGLEVMVSTDHDYHLDYTPIIAGLGIGNVITSIVGNEITTSVPNPPAFPNAVGHLNAWPLLVDVDAPRDGSIDDEFVAPNFIYSRLRDQGAQVIQYNHVRAGLSGLTSIGFFNNFGYDPDLPIGSPPNSLLLDTDVLGPGLSGVSNPDGFRNIDFDVLEVGNGTDVPGYIATRRDWFSLLNQTDFGTLPFIPGTGVSDSHRLIVEAAGYFRSYVGNSGDNPAALNVVPFNNNIKAGNMMATTGPYISFSVRNSGGSVAGLGQTLAPSSPTLTLDIRVQAAHWIPVEEVRVYQNGFLALTFDASTTPAVTPGGNVRSQSKNKVTRFDASIPLSIAQDSYFVVEAGAALSPLPAPDAFASQIVPGLVPLGFTNPIFVDLAGDGFDPPGLPVMASLSGDEDRPAFAHLRRLDEPLLAQVGHWWADALGSARRWGRAVAADGETEVLTGRDLEADIERRRAIPTNDYFPLYQFQIPPAAVEDAIRQLPPADQQRLREERARSAPQ
ncbi:MAG: CehA/McbA family metallohydrolase [Candidatus Binatia bacterium]